MINVPDPFTLSVVYMTTDAMPSIRLMVEAARGARATSAPEL